MKKIDLILIIMINSVFALDAKMEIIKKRSNLPIISISISEESIHNNLAIKIKDLIQKDLQVSGHFQIVEKKIQDFFNNRPNLKPLRDNKVDLF